MSHCIEALEASVALLVKQQNIMIEQQKDAILEQKTHREELDHSQKEFQERLEPELKIISSHQDMIKNRQEMIFTKQDQIQSTLHGETLPTQSPSTSVLASMSPPFTSPTASVAGFGPPSKVHVPFQTEVTDICSMLSESDLESILSLDWVTPFESQTDATTLLQHYNKVMELHILEQFPIPLLLELLTKRCLMLEHRITEPLLQEIHFLKPLLLDLHTQRCLIQELCIMEPLLQLHIVKPLLLDIKDYLMLCITKPLYLELYIVVKLPKLSTVVLDLGLEKGARVCTSYAGSCTGY